MRFGVDPRGSFGFTGALMAAIGIALLAASLAIWPQGAAEADYTPPASQYHTGIGSAGGLVWNYGTVLTTSDATSSWNSWTSTSKLANGSSGCGSSKACIVYRNDEGAFTINGVSCTLPSISSWAVTYISTDTQDNVPNCGSQIGTDQYPVFIVSFNNEISFGATAKAHIVRHEAGHALNLWDTAYTCQFDNGDYIPLMNNGTFGTCTSYPSNITASGNEVSAVISRNGW